MDNLKTAIAHTIGRDLTEHEIFRIMVSIDQDFPESDVWELYSKKEIEKAHAEAH